MKKTLNLLSATLFICGILGLLATLGGLLWTAEMSIWGKGAVTSVAGIILSGIIVWIAEEMY